MEKANMSFVDRLDDHWNGVTDWLETGGESGRTELAGTVTAMRSMQTILPVTLQNLLEGAL